MRSQTIASLLGIGSILAFGGCLLEDEAFQDRGESDPSAEDEAAEEQVFLVQVVDLNKGGEVVAWELVPESLHREQALRNQSGYGQADDAISESTGCFGTGLLKIWDQPNRPSSGANLICFTGDGLAFLNDYCRTCIPFGSGCLCTDYWGGDVESFETGNRDARFGDGHVDANAICCNTACSVRQSGVSVNAASSCEQAAVYVDRDSSDCACSTDPDC